MMQCSALIVEHNPTVLGEVVDVVESLGHRYWVASCQKEALKFLQAKQAEVSYLITGMRIPVRPESQYGRNDTARNFLRQIKQITPVPVIFTAPLECITKGYGPLLMREGAFDLIDLPAPSQGRNLGEAVSHAAEVSAKQPLPQENSLQDFRGGELILTNHSMTLCGVEIWTRGDNADFVPFLEHLLRHDSKGNRPRVGLQAIARKLGISQESVRNMVAHYRKEIRLRLLQEAGLRVKQFQIIGRAHEGGYYLPDSIQVQNDRRQIAATTTLPMIPEDIPGTERQTWILTILNQRGQLTRKEIEKKFNISGKTAQRDLFRLRDQGQIEFLGCGNQGRWVLCDPAALPC